MRIYTGFVMSFYMLMLFQPALAQYKTKQVPLNFEEYVGYVEVCVSCPFVKAEEGREYTFFEKEQIQTKRGTYEGSLLHGRAFLSSKETSLPVLEAEYFLGQPHNSYQEWLSSGDPVIRTEYKYGIKHGKSISYVFGILESEEIFNEGVSESAIYYTTDGLPNLKIEYQERHGLEKKIRTTYYTDQGMVVAEGIQFGDKEAQQTTLYNGLYKKYDKSGKLLVKGNYVNNLKNGSWTYFYGEVVNVKEYDNDQLVSETFIKNHEPFTGTATEFYSDGKPKLEIAVQKGIRDGKTLEYAYDRKPKVTSYKKGKVSGEDSFERFMKKQEVLSEQILKHQCDGRGTGLYVDKMQHTKKHTIVYMHIRNTAMRGETSYVFASAPGEDTSFTLINNQTDEKMGVQKVFQVYDQAYGNSLMHGEMLNFVLVFDRIPEKATNITLIEGNEAFTVSETGEEFFHWGCYDVVYKN